MKLKTVLELYDLETHQKKVGPDHHHRLIRRKLDLIITDWKRWWKEVSSRMCELRILKSETEIMKETLWSRIRRQNSVDKEFLEIVGSGKLTGSVQKETIAVSVTISLSVQKNNTAESFSKIFCAAECEKCVENQKSLRQKPKWRNGSTAVQGLPQRNLHHSILWHMASSRVLVLQVRKWMQIWWEVLLCTPPGLWTAKKNN